MSSGRCVAQVAVAAFALGVSLTGPHAAGTAAADSTEADSASSAPARPSRSAGAPSRGPVSRVDQVQVAVGQAPQRGGVPQPAAAIGGDEALPPVESVAQPRRAGRPGDRGRAAEPRAGSAPATPAASETSATALPASSNVIAAPSAAVVAASGAAVPPAVTPLTTVALPAAAAKALTSTPRPAPTPAVAALGAAITGFFDATANWLSGLPASPLTEMFQGALLLVRRSFFNLFPALNVGQTTGHTDPDPAYFTHDELSAYLLDLAKQQYGDLYGQTVPVYGYGPYPEYLKTDTAVSSDTNTQVDGVDEADYVENDGSYLYTAHNGRLTIVRSGDLSVASESPLTGNVVGEYLSGNRLTVLSQTNSGWYGPMVKMAYGYGQWKPQTTVTVYDVTDRTEPTVLSQTVFDGHYQSSRAVDGVAYLVLQRSVSPPTPSYIEYPTPIAYDDPATDPAIRIAPEYPVAYRTYESWESYVARVGGGIVEQSLPHSYRVDAAGNTIDLGLIAGAGDIVRPQTAGQQSLVTVVAVDPSRPAASGFADSTATMVSGWVTAVYMNKDALYVATNQDHYSDVASSADSRIDRFAVTGPKVGWQSSGAVPGTLINQFAMDEQNGYLRVVTHSTGSALVDGIWTARNDNGVYVLDTRGAELKQVGQLTGLAPGEQLYAVRYVGDTAYLVTFVRTDPLFAVGLSDPASPVLHGELVVPGFSNYLQSVGNGLLLGIGQERDAATGNTHLDATLFDVADGANLTEIDREYLDSGFQWSWSEGQFDHHALLYSAEDGLLVVPVSASGYDGQSGYRYEQFLKVLRVGPAGLEVVGEIHPREAAQRTVRIGDVLYAVGETSVTAYRISDLSEIGTTAASQSVV